MNTTIKEVKESAKQTIQQAIDGRIAELKRENDIGDITKQLSEFENDPYNTKKYRYEFDECGLLNAVMVLDLPNWLTDEDSDVIECLLRDLSDFMHIQHDCRDWTASNNLGDSVIIHDSATTSRGQYLIYSHDLKLKLMPDEVQSEEHGLYLIEMAMRKHGYFPNIVSVDYHGQFVSFVSTELGRLTDAELNDYGKQFDNTEDEE